MDGVNNERNFSGHKTAVLTFDVRDKDIFGTDGIGYVVIKTPHSHQSGITYLFDALHDFMLVGTSML